jgi:hypothetical protein
MTDSIEVEVSPAAYQALLSLIVDSIIQPAKRTPEGDVIA